MKVVITGGAGFIGSHLCEALANKADVKVIDNLSSGKLQNLDDIRGRVKFVKGDIRNLDMLRREFKGYDAVLHHAAFIEVAKSMKNPAETNEVNVNGTLNVLIAARDAGVKRVIFASSCAVYGDQDRVKESSVLLPKSPYAASKCIGEEYCKLFQRVYGLETVILRYFNVYGKRQPANTAYGAVIPNFISALKSGGRPIIFGDGKQTRDFVYVKDVVDANLLALKKNVAGKTFNIASGEGTSVLKLYEIISSVMNKKIRPKFEREREGDIKYISADIENTINYLSFMPKYSLSQGIKDFLS